MKLMLRGLRSSVICLFGILSCQNKEDAEIRLSNTFTVKSNDLIKQGKYDSAFLFADTAIQLYSSNFVAYNNRAFAEVMMNFPQEAIISDYLKSLSIKADYDIALYSFTNYLYSIKKYDSCIIYSKKFLLSSSQAETKKVINILSIKGESEYFKNDFSNASNDLLRALSLDSANKGVHKVLADCYLKTKKTDIAISHYSIAIKLDPNYFQAYLGRGLAYEAAGKLDLARQDFKKALNIKPDLEDIYNSNSSILAEQIRLDRRK